MTLRATVIMPCRDKADHVEDAIRAVLAQTYPCEVIISDQGSNDGTAQVINGLAPTLFDRHAVRVMSCPFTARRGMAGLNDHLNWITQFVTGDILAVHPADDVCDPRWIEKVVEVFDNGSTLATIAAVCVKKGHVAPGDTERVYGMMPKASGYVSTKVAIRDAVGAGGQCAYRTDFWRRHMPLQGIEAFDILFPILATLEPQGQMYYLDLDLMTHVERDDGDTVGMEGQARAATDAAHAMQISEAACFSHSLQYLSLLKRINRAGLGTFLGPDGLHALYEKIITFTDHWATQREAMTLMRVPPIPFKV